MKRIILTFGIFFFVISAHAKFRAREHYDYFNLKYKGESYTYKGLSNTINYFFKEVPKRVSYGLGLSTLGDNVENEDLSLSPFGSKLNLFQVDFEYKYFPKDLIEGVYFRHGAGISFLESRENFLGIHIQQAVGYEIPFKYLGMALELSGQYGLYEKGLRVGGLGLAIGFHFYKML